VKRACIVRHSFYPNDLLVQREALALAEIGLEVDVFCLRGSNQVAEESIDGIHVYRLPLGRRKGGIGRYVLDYFSFFWLVALKLTINYLRRPYAAIQVNTMPDFLVFATLIPRLLGAKVTLQMYEPVPELWATKFNSVALVSLMKLVEQMSLRYAHRAFAVTQQLKDTYVSRGADADKITVILNVPDSRLFEVAPTVSAPSGNGFRLICHGAIEERYGHDTMLQALSMVRSAIPGIQLRITGNGAYLDSFLTQVQALDLGEQVHYLGYVSLSQLVAELQTADVGIVAQKSSPYSNLVHTGKMYDYMAFGKPVIASRLRAVQAYFGGESIRFFEPGDAEDLAEAIVDLYRDPDLRRSLADNAGLLYERYKWENQRAVYQATYRSLLGPIN
jgi:glycosyltransferase involved in cell wall biosynthesis